MNPTLGDALSASIPEGYAIDESSIRLGIPEVSSDENAESVIIADVAINARATATFTPEQEADLIDRLEGTDDDEAEAILAAEPVVESYSRSRTLLIGWRGACRAMPAELRFVSMTEEWSRTMPDQRGQTGPERGRWQPGGRLIGLDIGSRRIGVAVSDEQGLIASPVGYVVVALVSGPTWPDRSNAGHPSV